MTGMLATPGDENSGPVAAVFATRYGARATFPCTLTSLPGRILEPLTEWRLARQQRAFSAFTPRSGHFTRYTSMCTVFGTAPGQIPHCPRLKFRPGEVESTLATIRNTANVVQPTETLKISADDADNRFYECAKKASADYIITGNLKHFPKPHQNTQIVGARQLLQILERKA